MRAFFIKLTDPVLALALILLLSLILPRLRKVGLTLFIILFLVFSIPASSKAILGWLTIDDTFQEQKHYDAAIILGGYSDFGWHQQLDKSIRPPNIHYHKGNDSVARLLTGIALVKNNHVERLYLGSTSKYNLQIEDTLTPYLLQEGLTKEQFVFYASVKTTQDEAREIANYVSKQQHPPKLLLITDHWHMSRAHAIFTENGLNPDRLSIDMAGKISSTDFIPNKHGLSLSRNVIYAFGARTKHFIQTLLKPEDDAADGDS